MRPRAYAVVMARFVRAIPQVLAYSVVPSVHPVAFRVAAALHNYDVLITMTLSKLAGNNDNDYVLFELVELTLLSFF